MTEAGRERRERDRFRRVRQRLFRFSTAGPFNNKIVL